MTDNYMDVSVIMKGIFGFFFSRCVKRDHGCVNSLAPRIKVSGNGSSLLGPVGLKSNKWHTSVRVDARPRGTSEPTDLTVGGCEADSSSSSSDECGSKNGDAGGGCGVGFSGGSRVSVGRQVYGGGRRQDPLPRPTPRKQINPKEERKTKKLEMGKMAYLAVDTDGPIDLIESDLRELGLAARKLANHAFELGKGGGLGSGTTFFKSLASLAAIYLLILDRTNWRTSMLTSLLIPYIFLSLPSVLFSLLRGEVGKWIAFVAVVLHLFFPRHFPDWLEMPGSLILLLAVTPGFFAHAVRDGPVGNFVCLAIGCYLLQEHIRASGGFRNSLTQSHGISNTLGIILLLVYPVWRLVLHLH